MEKIDQIYQTLSSQTSKSNSELKTLVEKNCLKPVVIVGYSWGAWIAYIFAARYPEMVKKIILVSAGPFEQKYYPLLEKNRESRMNAREKQESQKIFEKLFSAEKNLQNELVERLGKLYEKVDGFDLNKPLDQNKRKNGRKNPIIQNLETNIDRVAHFTGALEQAIHMRKSGQLLELGRQIQCPVCAIHGINDTHPIEGVKEPLSNILEDFQLFPLR